MIVVFHSGVLEAPSTACNLERPRPAPARRRPVDAGNATVELVVLTPVLILFLVLVVFAGRAGGALQLVHHAADEAARAASQASAPRMVSAANLAAAEDLRGSGVACSSIAVAVNTVTTGVAGSVSAVTVTVTCTVDDEGLDALAPGTRTLVGRSTEVVDRFRGGQ